MTHPIDDKTPSKEWSLVDKIKETKAVVHKESSETDEKNLNKEPEKQKVKKEKMKIVAGNHLLCRDSSRCKNLGVHNKSAWPGCISFESGRVGNFF